MSDGVSRFSSNVVLPPSDLLQANRTRTGGPLTAARLMPTAKEFESILLGQWLQGAESSFGSVPGGDDAQDAGDEQMKNFGVQQLAKSLSDSGGIGIAALVSRALAKSTAMLPKP